MNRDDLLTLLAGIMSAEEAVERLEQAGLLPLEAEWRWEVTTITDTTLTSTKQWRHVTAWR